MMGTSESESDSNEKNSKVDRIQEGVKPYKIAAIEFYHSIFSRKPVYKITKTGVEVEYYDITKPETLPFDLETYRETQIFIGSYANPWYVDIESMKENYPDFTEDEITEVDDIFGTEHIYPSQRWKLLANQNVLEQMFLKSSVDTDRLQQLLYIILAGVGLLIAVLLFS